MAHLILGTTDGVHQLRDRKVTPLGLQGHRVSAIHTRTSDGNLTILAGTYGDGLYRSTDAGQNWDRVDAGLTASTFRTIDDDPFDSGAILAGTEPGRIFRSTDTGMSWRELEGITNVPRVDEWFLPYSPRAGAVRNIYSPPGSGTLLAAVEVGGMLRSEDRGESWSVGPILGDTDIHHVTGHPQEPDVLFAALGWATLKSVPVPPDVPPVGGVARSDDGGRTWTKSHSHYTRAVLVPPAKPDLVIAGPAPKVGREGWIEVSADGGESWTPASDGIETPMPDMVELFVPSPDGTVLAICSGGALLSAIPGEWQWTSLLPEASAIRVESLAFA